MVQLNLIANCTNIKCYLHAEKWFKYFVADLPPVVALLQVDPTVEYFDIVNTKTRNMVRKAVKLGYHSRLFKYNYHLGGMYNINVSAPERQGRAMSYPYTKELTKIDDNITCSKHNQYYVGVFADKELVAYCWLAVSGEVAVINRILGHSDHLKFGIMNLLIAGIYGGCQEFGVKYINYRTMESTTDGLKNFKRHCGFKPVQVEVVL